MAVHMLRYICDESADAGFIGGGVPDLLGTHPAWSAGGPNENTAPTFAPPPADSEGDSETAFYTAEWRFEWTANRNAILNRLAAMSDLYTDWYQIAYHECDHDADATAGCQWDEVIEGGDVPIPDDVPTVSVPDGGGGTLGNGSGGAQ